MSAERRTAGFKEWTAVDDARRALLDRVSPVERTASVAVGDAGGRVLAARVTAPRPVPHYDRVTVDGYAVRASDTAGAGDRSPARLDLTGAGQTDDGSPTDGQGRATRVEAGTAVAVASGAALPDGADAVVRVEGVDRTPDGLAVREAVAPGTGVRATGADVAAGATLAAAGATLDPGTRSLALAAGVETLPCRDRPRVAIQPVGDRLVASDPGTGDVVETDAAAVAGAVGRWGGSARRRDPVVPDGVEAAIRDPGADLLVTVGATGVGPRDLAPDAVDALGTLAVHGVAVRPGRTAGVGTVAETPLLLLPGPPAACAVAAGLFLRPAVRRCAGRSVDTDRATAATLDRKVASGPGVQTVAGVELTAAPDGPVADPVLIGGGGGLSDLAAIDGWVTVPPAREGLDAGASVAVADWGWSA
ncbi:MAG: molybdopterin molybdotransferase MoeA [Halobacteriaceae archaeon]